MNGSTTALHRPCSRPYDCPYEWLCIVSTNALHRLYKRLCVVFTTGSTTALRSPVQSPYDRPYKRLCTVSTNGSTPSLRTAPHHLYEQLYRLYDRLYIVSTTALPLLIQSPYNRPYERLCIISINGFITALQRLYKWLFKWLYKQLYKRLYDGSIIACIVTCNHLYNGSATALQIAL